MLKRCFATILFFCMLTTLITFTPVYAETVYEYTDTFENSNNWSGSNWSVANGVATTTTASAIYTFQPSGGILTTPTAINDYTISADFTTTVGNALHAIVFRQNGGNYYMFRAGYKYVEFYKMGSGQGQIAKSSDNNAVSSQAGDTYNLKVVVKGNTFTGYYNGIELLTVTDDTNTTGTIGIRSNTAVSVDNFYVCRSDKPVTYEYTDTFENASNWSGSNWTVANGIASTSNAQAIYTFQASGGILTNPTTINDYTISADFTTTVGNAQHAIVFRQNGGNYYMFRAGYKYVEFYKMGSGQGQIAKSENNNIISSQAGDTYNLKVVLKGNTFTGYYNGVEMLTVKDNSYTTGTIGVRSNAGVSVDNFYVCRGDKPVTNDYTDTFENADNWNLGNWTHNSTNKNIEVSTASQIAEFKDNDGIITDAENYTIAADFTTTLANKQHAIVFKRSGNNFYMFRTDYINGAGVQFYKMGSSQGEIKKQAYADAYVAAGETYNLKVVVKGNTFTGYFNGVEVLTVTDDTYTSGTVGVRSNEALSIDNFYISRDNAEVINVVDMTDTFDNSSNWSGADWTVTDGKASVSDNTVNALYTFQAYGGLLTKPTATDNYIVSADFTTTNSSSLHGIAFRINGNNAYLFRAKNGYAEFFKIGNGQGTISSKNSTNIVINDGDTYNLKVVVKGDTFTGYFNGIKILSLTDTALASGNVGIRSNGAVVADNFYVCRGDANLRLANIGTQGENAICMISPDQNACAVAIDDKNTLPTITVETLNSSDSVSVTQSTSFNEPATITISNNEGAIDYYVYFMQKNNGTLPSAQIYTNVSQVDDSIIISSKVFNPNNDAEVMPIAALFNSNTSKLLGTVVAQENIVPGGFEVTTLTFPYVSSEQEELTIKTFLLNNTTELAPLCKAASISHTQPTTGLAVPSVFSDNMVLQRNKPINVWGKAVKGETVTVSFAGQTKSVVATNGKWELELDPVDAGGPYTLTISSNEETITCNDVLVGEVWICAGQSNMMWKLKNTDEAATDIPNANFPNVRYFYQDTIRDSVPKFDVQNGDWQIVTPEIAGEHAALSFYFGTKLHQDLNVPVGIINVAVGATAIQAHMNEKTINSVKEYMTQPDDELETCVYNSMIKPLQPYANAGVLWYQGEANSARNEHGTYKHLLTALINQWREQWKTDDLPFITVQLPKYSTNTIYKWPVLREAFVDVMNSMDNVGMVVSIDTGVMNDIHPTNKKPVAYRLVSVAEAMVYGIDIPYMSPMYKEMSVSGDEIILTFDYADNGFKLSEGTEILGFEICGENQLFTPADVRIVDNNKLAVRSDKVSSPVAVRYAWEQFPDVNLYNTEGFPVCPFRTDNFDPNTKKMK